MALDDLSEPGSSTYSSNTLNVGDGTWDSTRNDFLLPNLQGLNFATMRYNGMGNRFRDLPQYHRLIIGHGALAAITFLAILPAAVFIAKFGMFSPRMSVKLHVYLQILVVFLSTVILVLGYFAVGPERSLTNPHHGIGVAIYVLILAQFLFGWLMARLERRRKDLASLTRTPTKVWFHKIMGRSIGTLAIVQIALGLTLYGSPKYLFILYALATAFLLFLYLTLDRYYFEKRRVEYDASGHPDFYSDYGSYISGTRTELTGDRRPAGRIPPRDREGSHWGRNILAAGGALGAYEAFKERRMRRREEREQLDMDEDERRYGRPGPPPPGGAIAPSGITQSAVSDRPLSRPPPGVTYGAGGVPTVRTGSRPPSGGRVTMDDSRLSAQSWEDEKYDDRTDRRNTWRDRILGGVAGVGAYEGIKRVFSRRGRRDDGYVDDYGASMAGRPNVVSQNDVSRVQGGDVPLSPDARVNMAGIDPMTPTATPSRPPRQTRINPNAMSMDDEESFLGPDGGAQQRDSHTLRDSIATLGAVAGFREWNNRRKMRKEAQRNDMLRRQELENEEQYNRRHSDMYPRPQDASGGRRHSLDGTILTGETHDGGFAASNTMISRTNRSGAPDTMHPPLPVGAGMIPTSASGAAPSTIGPSISQQRVHETAGGSTYNLPPPPAGPPPGGIRPGYPPPASNTLQMPTGAIEPDPSRLMSSENVSSHQSHAGRDALAAAGIGAAAAGIASERRRRNSQSDSPSRFQTQDSSRNRLRKGERRDEFASTSVVNEQPGPSSPPLAVKVKYHNDAGRHVTLQRLNEEQAAAEHRRRATQRPTRRTGRGNSFSSAGADEEVEAPPGSNRRYRRHSRNGSRSEPVRRSSEQPIANVPAPPPAVSSSVLTAGGAQPYRRRSSELRLPPAGAAPPRPPQHADSPSSQGISPPIAGGGPTVRPVGGSGLSGFGSPGAGTETDVSNFADSRRRRRAERARNLEAARGGKSVEFE